MTDSWVHRIGRLLLKKPVMTLSGFVKVPGLISLAGVAISALTVWADAALIDHARSLGLPLFGSDLAETVFSMLAGAAMTALSLVYSIVLVVFTLAAANIGPRLLERFSQDRTNQIAVGFLGALFLHSLVSLIMIDEGPGFFAVAAAVILAAASVLLLLFFVDKVASRVTIDEEIARIAGELDRQFAREEARVSGVEADTLVRPMGRESSIRAPQSGYINRIEMETLASRAAALGSFVDFHVSAGDHVLKGDKIGFAVGGDSEAMAVDAVAALALGTRRTADGDLRFSINLLLEIALRALSPGVNDTYTAIACIDRLTACFQGAAALGLRSGVYCDEGGAARVFIPRSALGDLIRLGYDPIRQSSRGNFLTSGAMVKALARLGPHLPEGARAEADRQIELIIEETRASDALSEDIESLFALARDRVERHSG